MLEKKVVNVPTNKTYTSPEDIAALGKFLRKVKEKQEEIVTLQEDNLALPERDVRDGNIKDLKDHQLLIKTEVIGIDDLNKLIINLTLSEKIELEKKVSPLEEKELIDKLPDESEKISPSEVSLKKDKSLLRVEENLSLGNKKEELLVKENISLSDKSEKIEDNQEVELDNDNEKIRTPEDPQLDNSKEELKEGEEVKLSDKISKLSESQEIELETEKSLITDNMNIPLEDEKSLLEGDQQVDLENEKSLLSGDKEIPLEDEKSLLEGDQQVDLENEKSLITDNRDILLDNDSSKISDPSLVSLDEDRFNIKSPDEVPLEDESSPLTPPASESEITSYLKNYTGYSAGMKYLMNLSGENIQLTLEERKSLEEIKKYVGLASGDDKTAAKYQVTVDSLKKMGTWGEKFAAYLTAVLNRNKNFRSIIPYSDIDLLYSAITSWEDKETGLRFKYGIAEDNQEGSGAKVVELTSLYNTTKETKGEEGREGIVDKLKEDLATIKDDKEPKEIWDESSHEAFSNGKGESLRIPESKLPEISWKSGVKIGTFLRYAVEETIGRLHRPELTGATRQELIDSTLSALIIARLSLEKITKTEKYRLPGTGNFYVDQIKSLTENGINKNSIVKTISAFKNKDANKLLNAPVVDKGRVFDPKDKEGNTAWEGYLYKGNYNIDSNDNKYSGLEITLQDLANITNFPKETLSNYNDFLLALKNSKIISTANLFTATENSPRVMTLDSNHVWEVTLEPYLGPENGNISFLPAYREINQLNLSTHGFKTSWGTWIPFTSYELNIKKLVSKTVPLYDGEISYPTGMEFTNELRLTIADDQYKSWKIYFEEVMKCMAYLSRPHSSTGSFSWELKLLQNYSTIYDAETLTGSEDEFSTWDDANETMSAKIVELNQNGYSVDNSYVESYVKYGVLGNSKNETSIPYDTYDEAEKALNERLSTIADDLDKYLYGVTPIVTVVNTGDIKDVLYDGDSFGDKFTGEYTYEKINGESIYKTPDYNYTFGRQKLNQFLYYIESKETSPTKYKYTIVYRKATLTSETITTRYYYYDSSSTSCSAFLEGVINPAPYKNVTFRCRIYSMTPQFSTIQKYDLLVILKDLQEEFLGEIDSGPTDLSLAFSIVGENPMGESFYNKSVDNKKPNSNVTEKTQEEDKSSLSKLESSIKSSSNIIS